MKRMIEIRRVEDGNVSEPMITFSTSKKVRDLSLELKAILNERWKGTGASEVIGEEADEETHLTDTGVTSFVRKGNIITNSPEISNPDVYHHTGNNSFVIGNYDKPANCGPLFFHTGKGEVKTDYSVVFTVYPVGYVLNTGKMSYSIFGKRIPLYLKSIGTRNIRSRDITEGHIFPDLKALAKYLESHKKSLVYVTREYGYDLSVEPACILFSEDMDSIPEKDKRYLPEVERILDEISAEANVEESTGEELSGTASEEERVQEAVLRLVRLGVPRNPVVNEFKTHRKIYQSENGGILYDLNEETEKAVQELKKYSDKLPYAVVTTHAIFGTCHAVLYVSREKSDWECERPDRKGFCVAFVYNTDNPEFSEFGEICVQEANGGLVRTV